MLIREVFRKNYSLHLDVDNFKVNLVTFNQNSTLHLVDKSFNINFRNPKLELQITPCCRQFHKVKLVTLAKTAHFTLSMTDSTLISVTLNLNCRLHPAVQNLRLILITLGLN